LLRNYDTDTDDTETARAELKQKLQYSKSPEAALEFQSRTVYRAT